MEKLFIMFKDRNLKLHPEKCCFFATSIRWCGRLLSSAGVRFDPRRIDGIQKMQLPTNGAHLQQFVCALQWVKTAIPNFTALVEPLHRFLENVYKVANARTKRSVSKILLSAVGWGEKESSASTAADLHLSARSPSHIGIRLPVCASTRTHRTRFGLESSPRYPVPTCRRRTKSNGTNHSHSSRGGLTRRKSAGPPSRKKHTR